MGKNFQASSESGLTQISGLYESAPSCRSANASLARLATLLAAGFWLYVQVGLWPVRAYSQTSSDGSAIQQWSGQLQSKIPVTVGNAAYYIAKHADQFQNNEEIVSSLTELLNDTRRLAPVREVAAFALGSLGPTAKMAVPSLLRAVDSNDSKVKRAAVEAIGRIGTTDTVSIDKIHRILDETDRVEIRVACIEALVMLLPKENAIALLHKQIGFDNADVKISCIRGFAKLLPKSALIPLLADEVGTKDPKVQRAAVYILAPFGPDAIVAAPALQQSLRSKDPSVREVSAWAFGFMGPGASAYASVLADVLEKDTDPVIRRLAADSLGSIGSDDNVVVSALVNQLTNDPNLDVKNACATALGGIGNGKAVADALFTAISVNNDSALQLAAVSELAKMDPQSNADVASLLRLSVANDYHLREQSLEAIGHIHQQGQLAIPNLIDDVQRDPQPTVRIAAARSLGRYATYLSSGDAALTTKTINALILACTNGKTHFAASQSIGQIADALRDRRQKLPLSQDASLIASLKDAERDLKQDVNIRSDDVDSQSLDSVQQALSTLTRKLWLARGRRWLLTHHYTMLATSAISAYILWLLFLRFIALSWFPLSLIKWGDALSTIVVKTPAWLGGSELKLKNVLLLNYYRHPLALDAWVEQYADIALVNFKALDTCKARLTYFPLPLIWDSEVVAELTPDDLRDQCRNERWCLRIIGEGGSGKTSIACRIALWALEANPLSRISVDRRMIPVMLERSSGATILANTANLVAAIRGQLQNLIAEPDPPPEWLCDELLRDRRVLVIVDGLSEMDYDADSSVLPLSADFPVAALIITARSNSIWAGAVHADLRTIAH